MELRLKLWHIIAATFVVVLMIIFGISLWKQNNARTISDLKEELQESNELYKQRERTIDSIISLQESEHKRALEAEERAEKAEKGLEVALKRIKAIEKKERYEKDRIANLDSSEQFKLLRSNLDRRGR